MYLQQTLLGTLNGLGKQGICLRNTVIGYFIRIGFVQYYIPINGVTGYVWGIIASSAIVCILNLYTVIKTTGMTLDLRNWIIKPGLVCMLMILSGKYVYSFFTIFGSGRVSTMILTLIGSIAIGLGLMFAVGVLNKNEITRLIYNKN
jgi:stage V sporulation protein B